MDYKPTEEQQKIVEVSKSCKVLKVEALAGSGKTSTLELVAEANPVPSIYLTFNKAMALEAASKFPYHVECKTIHSMAYKVFGAEIRHKLTRPKGRYVNVAGTASEVAKYYNLKPIFDSNEEDCAFSSTFLGLLVQQTVNRFEQSGDKKLTEDHVPHKDISDKCKKFDVYAKSVRTIISDTAKKLWNDRKDLLSPVLATHDTYLKLYQLTEPKLNYDILYLDEAQDSNQVTLDIVLKQDCRKIIVGDTYQSIYGFRGAVNALDRIEAPTLKLTTSFRFGQDLADVANNVIRKIKMKGYGKTEVFSGDKLDPTTLPEGSCLLFRSNIAMVKEAINLVSQGVDVDMPANITNIKSAISSATALKSGDLSKVKHTSLIPFSSWQEFKDSVEDDPELKGIYDLTKGSKKELDRKLKILDSNDKTSAKYSLRTAHGSKGLEWDVVMMMGDFSDELKTYEHSQQETNLLYVTLTRAKKTCYINKITNMMCEEALEIEENFKKVISGESRADMAAFMLEDQIMQESNGWL